MPVQLSLASGVRCDLEAVGTLGGCGALGGAGARDDLSRGIIDVISARSALGSTIFFVIASAFQRFPPCRQMI